MGTKNNHSRPRRIPKQERSRAVVVAIQEAALLVLSQEGFEGFTTNAVADRAGVGIGSVYRYFPNKESIVASITRDCAEALRNNTQAMEHFGALDLRCRVRFAIMGVLADQREILKIGSELSDHFEQAVRIEVASPSIGAIRFWRTVLQPDAECAQMSEELSNPRLAEMLWAIADGLLPALLTHDPKQVDDPDFLERVVALAMSCLPEGSTCKG